MLDHRRTTRKRGENMNILYALVEVFADLQNEIEGADDNELAELLVLLHQQANIILMEAKRRDVLEVVMKRAMTLDGAPEQQ